MDGSKNIVISSWMMERYQTSKLQAIQKSYQAIRAVGAKKIKLHNIEPSQDTSSCARTNWSNKRFELHFQQSIGIP